MRTPKDHSYPRYEVCVSVGARELRDGYPPMTAEEAALLDAQGLTADHPEDWELVRTVEVEVQLDRKWIAIVELVPELGSPVVAGVEIRSRYSIELDAPADETTPTGGLTARVYKSLKLSEVVARARGALHELDAGLLRLHDYAHETIDRAPGRRGRPGRPPIFYASVAAAYVRVVERGERRPVAVVAKASGLSENQVHAALRKARDLGYLTRPGQGKAGGELTAEAREVLRQPDVLEAAPAAVSV